MRMLTVCYTLWFHFDNHHAIPYLLQSIDRDMPQEQHPANPRQFIKDAWHAFGRTGSVRQPLPPGRKARLSRAQARLCAAAFTEGYTVNVERRDGTTHAKRYKFNSVRQ